MHRILLTAAVAVILAALPSCTVRRSGPVASDESPETEVSTSDSPAPTSPSPDVEAGDCIESPDVGDVEVSTIDCADPAAVYQVAVALASPTSQCPDGSYETHETDELTLCLMLNAREGECFAGMFGAPAYFGPIRSDCATADGTVTRVLPGTADERACPAGTALPLVYPEPPPGRTVCVTRV